VERQNWNLPAAEAGYMSIEESSGEEVGRESEREGGGGGKKGKGTEGLRTGFKANTHLVDTLQGEELGVVLVHV